MTPSESRLPIATLRRLVSLDPETGLLIWLARSVEFFCDDNAGKTAEQYCCAWNKRLSGKHAVNNKQGMGYLHGDILGVRFLAHRVVWALHTGCWPVETIDHIDGVKKNNRPANLRDVTHKANMRNQRPRSNNTSGHIGIGFDHARGKFVANVTVDAKTVHLGRFQNSEEAAFARDAAYKAHGFHKNHGRIAS